MLSISTTIRPFFLCFVAW